VRSGSGYASQPDLRLHFGLGANTKIDALKVRWPGGKEESVAALGANQLLVIEEGKGIVEKKVLTKYIGAYPLGVCGLLSRWDDFVG
jgi:hypothetical protein